MEVGVLGTETVSVEVSRLNAAGDFQEGGGWRVQAAGGVQEKRKNIVSKQGKRRTIIRNGLFHSTFCSRLQTALVLLSCRQDASDLSGAIQRYRYFFYYFPLPLPHHAFFFPTPSSAMRRSSYLFGVKTLSASTEVLAPGGRGG